MDAGSEALRTAQVENAAGPPVSVDAPLGREHAMRGDVEVVGKVVSPGGSPAGTQVRLLSGGSVLATIATDPSGSFRVIARVTGADLRAVASNEMGATGEVVVPFESSQRKIVLPDIVLRRRFASRLMLNVQDSAYGAVRERPGRVVAVLARVPRISILAPPDRILAGFSLSAGAQQEQSVDVECADENRLRWFFELPGGQRCFLHEEDLDRASTVRDFVCSVDMSMLLQGRCVDRSGAILPSSPFLVEVKSPVQQDVWICTDRGGEFFVITARQAVGAMRLKWANASFAWATGGYHVVTCDAIPRIMVCVRSQDGVPVSNFALSGKNIPVRSQDGLTPSPGLVWHSSEGVLASDWSELASGSRIFVYVPTLGEYVHVVENGWRIQDGLLEIRLVHAADGAAVFRRDPTRGVTSKVINVHLVGSGSPDRRFEYRIMLTRDGADGWVSRNLFPGEYECTVSHSGLVIRRSIEVKSGGTVEVVY